MRLKKSIRSVPEQDTVISAPVTTAQTPKPVPSSYVAKVGDKVEFISVSYGAMESYIGQTGVVWRVRRKDHVDVDVDGGRASVKSSDLKPLPSSYTPQAGDVVEFEYKGKTCKGLVYVNGRDFWIISKWGGNHYDSLAGDGYNTALKTARKIDSCPVPPDIYCNQAYVIIEDYFDNLDSQPHFTGTYAERQKQWVEHYGIKVGSKVKVVRSYTTDEDGYDGHGKDEVGFVGVFTSDMDESGIQLDDSVWFPYFALEPVKE